MNEIIQGISINSIEEVTGESQKVIKQWKKGTRKIPESAIRLIRFYLHSDASAILGKDWQGHVFRYNLLYIPEWRNGFSPHELRSLLWRCQLNSCLESEIR